MYMHKKFWYVEVEDNWIMPVRSLLFPKTDAALILRLSVKVYRLCMLTPFSAVAKFFFFHFSPNWAIWNYSRPCFFFLKHFPLSTNPEGWPPLPLLTTVFRRRQKRTWSLIIPNRLIRQEMQKKFFLTAAENGVSGDQLKDYSLMLSSLLMNNCIARRKADRGFYFTKLHSLGVTSCVYVCVCVCMCVKWIYL